MTFHAPWFLLGLPLALLPLWYQQRHRYSYSCLALIPSDPWSTLVGWLLRLLVSMILLMLILGMASPHGAVSKVERIGKGAQLVLVLDRSASMDDLFSGDGHVAETKSAAASRLMSSFVRSRLNDMFGMVTFSNSAMYVLPLSHHREAVLAAISATTNAALMQTNIGAGLTSGIGLFNHVPDSGSRAIILISDGAGRMSDFTQEKIKDWLHQHNVALYWIVLRKSHSMSIFDAAIMQQDPARIPPEAILYQFFKTLRSPFYAYEADNPQALAMAVQAINDKERKTIRYDEEIPGKNYSARCYMLSAVLLGVLLLLQYIEVRSWALMQKH